MPADASLPSPPPFDQLREHPGALPEEIPGLLERLAEVPDPRDPRGVRHALVVVLALTACAVLAGAASAPAPGQWWPATLARQWHRRHRRKRHSHTAEGLERLQLADRHGGAGEGNGKRPTSPTPTSC
ncbi:transposase family protein [Streptomyces sp. NPDC057445]|uniref:transposase family protein n=1 Tax=Streptomyces sp. NPDC057445 TaxID=3346136 RepID=UPI0036AC5550